MNTENKIKLNILVSADISKKSIEEMVRKSVEEATGRQVKSVEFKVGTRYEGYGPAEHEVSYFDGAHIVFEKD